MSDREHLTPDTDPVAGQADTTPSAEEIERAGASPCG